MDHDDCLRIRLNVICLSALIGDLDVEKCPNLPKTRNVLSEYGQFSPILWLKTTCLCYSLMLDGFLFIICKSIKSVLSKCTEIEKCCVIFSILKAKINFLVQI